MNRQIPQSEKKSVLSENESKAKAKSYKGSYVADNRPDAIAQLSAISKGNTNSSSGQQYNTELSIGKSSGIIQCVNTEGEFRPALTFNGAVIIPAGAHRADLFLVMRNLSRIPSLQIQWMENHLGCPVTFRTAPIADLAETVFEANIGGVWRNMDDICDPADAVNHPLGLQLDRDTPMRAIITLNPALHNVLPNNHLVAATLVHEITVHLTHIFPWLRALRSGAFQGAGIRSKWRTSGIAGGLASPDQEHDTFGRGDNRSYNESVQNIHEELTNTGGPAAAFQADVRADMNDHVPFGVAPNYPI